MVGEMPHIGTGKVSADLSDRTSLCVIANHQLNTSMHDYIPHCTAVTKGMEFLFFKKSIGKPCSDIVYEWAGHKGGLLPYTGKNPWK